MSPRQCSLQEFVIEGCILEYIDYLHHNLMCFVIRVYIYTFTEILVVQ